MLLPHVLLGYYSETYDKTHKSYRKAMRIPRVLLNDCI